MGTPTRNVVAAVQISLDGYMQGPAGEVDWVESWNEALGLVPEAEVAVIGGGTFPGYEQLWGAIAADPDSGAGMLGRPATDGEIEYARWTQRTPHYVLSATLDKSSWASARLVRSIGELGSLLAQPGGTVYVIGGPALVSSMINEGLISELRMIVHPVVLGGGKAPLAGLKERRSLWLTQAREDASGRAVLTYRV